MVSVSLALSQAVLPKASWLADRELQTLDWPVHGLPRTIYVDNAKEFHAEALVRGCQEYGIRLDHRPPGRPHFGGHIERLIGTMMGAVHLLPGTTFSMCRREGLLCLRRACLVAIKEGLDYAYRQGQITEALYTASCGRASGSPGQP